MTDVTTSSAPSDDDAPSSEVTFSGPVEVVISVLLDTSGRATAFYRSDINGEAPAGAVTITEAQWRSWIADQSQVLVDGALKPAPAVTPPPKTIFTPREVIMTLFTSGEQEALYKAAQTPNGWQVAMFISLVTATPSIDVTNPEFIADIGVVEAAGLITSGRAAQILAGTAAPTS